MYNIIYMSDNNSQYEYKYLKYKNKYLELKKIYDEQLGGEPACSVLQKFAPTMTKEGDALYIQLPRGSDEGGMDTFKVKLVNSVQNLLASNKELIVHGNVKINVTNGKTATITVNIPNPVTFSNVDKKGPKAKTFSPFGNLTLQGSQFNKVFTFTTSNSGNSWSCAY